MVKNKLGSGLPVNIVVTMIIGLTIFGLGMGLFSKISGSAGGTVEDLQADIKTDIASLECKGDEWICSPSNSMKNGAEETFLVYIANQANTDKTFRVKLSNLVPIDDQEGVTKACGSLIISSLPNYEIKLKSGYSGTFPYIARATRVSETPCSFIASVVLEDVDGSSGLEPKKAAVIINVE